MNSIVLFISSSILVGFVACSEAPLRYYDVTYYFINETSNNIYAKCSGEEGIIGGEKIITPKSTMTYKQFIQMNELSSIDDFIPFPRGGCSFSFSYDKVITDYERKKYFGKCYERKEITPLIFEFTFRFTEEKKGKAAPCEEI